MEPTNLRMLIEMAVAARDGAAGQLAQARAHLAQAQNQLAALKNYAVEYASRARTQAYSGMDAATQANWRAFDGKLEVAVAQQSHEIERRQARVQAAQNELADMQRRLKSLETLAARQAQQAQQKAARREQKHNDELAARTAASTTSSGTQATTTAKVALHW